MPAAAMHPDEEARIAALHALRLLDSVEESAFDDIVHLASEICDVPIALFSLVDKDRQWFKARVGVDALETPRSQAFCAHAILNASEPLVVCDATKDPRFSDNPLVTSDPNIRFYAGIPILSSGRLPLGTLCVIDQRPAELSERQLQSLARLAKQVENLLELRSSTELLKETQVQLHQHSVELETANGELEQFAYVASHDLKQPLRGISHLATWIKEDSDGTLNETASGHLGKLMTCVTRMERLLDDLLEYSQINRGQCQTEQVDVKQVVLDAISLVDAPETFQVQCLGDFPILTTSRGPLEQVFRNLIGNAIKHRESDTGKVEVSARPGPSSDQYVFAISDDGPGIPRESCESIFQMFQTLRPRDQVDGSGMGLALVKKIVSSRGGTVSVQSNVGAGAKFTFSWPA